jgi:hypothetical protein
MAQNILRWLGVVLATSALASVTACGGKGEDEGGGSGAGAKSGSGAANGSAGEGTAGVGQGGASNGSGATNGSGAGSGATTGAGGGAGTGKDPNCKPGTSQCTNCIDDDKDGLYDAFDPECVSALDNNEATYATGIPGDNKDPFWQDCFFDGDSGAGNDRCRYHTDCVTGKLPTSDSACQVSADCGKYCGKLTPNGCDCFGCCNVGGHFVQLSATCTEEDVADPKKCAPCKQDDTCKNDCGECELCMGKTELPESCKPAGTGGTSGSGGSSSAGGSSSTGGSGASTGGTPAQECPLNVAACDPTHPCESGYFCVTGCCIEILR